MFAFSQPSQDDLTIKETLANSVKQHSNAQPCAIHLKVFKAPNFTGEGKYRKLHPTVPESGYSK